MLPSGDLFGRSYIALVGGSLNVRSIKRGSMAVTSGVQRTALLFASSCSELG